MSWLKNALRKLFSRPLISSVFILNLSLGMVGLQVVLCFKQSIDENLKQSSKEILAADLAVRSRRELTEEEKKNLIKELPAHTQADSLSFYSMGASSQQTELMQVRAISENYPLYGEIILRHAGLADAKAVESLQATDKIWVYPELLEQLEVAVGDKIELGKTSFVIADVIEKDNAQVASATSFAPTLVMGIERVEKTGLIQFGSTVRYAHFFRWQEKSVDTALVVERVEKKISDPAISISGHEESDSQVGRMIKYLSDYLGMVALVALLLANIGGAFLIRALLFGQVKDLAIMRTLGAKPRVIPLYLCGQIGLSGLAAVGISSLFTSFVLPILQRLSEDLFPGQLSLALSLPSILISFIVGVLVPLLVAQPMISKISQAKPSEMFSNFQNIHWLKQYRWWHFLFFMTLTWALAVWQTKSFFTASLFTGAFWGSGLVMASALFFVLRRMPMDIRSGSLAWRWVWLSLSRKTVASASLFLVLGLAVLMVALIPQIDHNIQKELHYGEQSGLPSFFLFDIQEDQLEELKKVLSENGRSLDTVSALIRGRIITANGKRVERFKESEMLKTRESERETQFRNRGVNLTYRQDLSESESLIAGVPFSGKYDEASGKPAEISVEFRYAKRLGLKLGDVLVFDIQGVEVPAKVVSLRHVRWTSFQPNFFIQFQPGVIDEAPKTFVASVSGVSAAEGVGFRKTVVKNFSNVSLIDLHRLIERILSLTQKMTAVLQGMSALCFFCGLAVLFSVVFYQSEERKKESSLLKTLGVSPDTIRWLNIFEIACLTLFAVFCGTGLSLIVSYVFTVQLFQTVWHLNLEGIAWVFVGAMACALTIGSLALMPVLRARPWALLRD